MHEPHRRVITDLLNGATPDMRSVDALPSNITTVHGIPRNLQAMLQERKVELTTWKRWRGL